MREGGLAVGGVDADEPVNEEVAHDADGALGQPRARQLFRLSLIRSRTLLHTHPAARLHQIGGKNDLIVICGPAGALINHTVG